MLVLCLAAGLFACDSSGKKKDLQKYSCNIWDSFDTVITVMAFCESEEEFRKIESASGELFREYNQLFDIYNDYEGIANIKTINDNAGVAPVKVSEDIIRLIYLGKNLYEETDGNVNIAFGSVLKIWHDAREAAEADPDKAYVPDADMLREAAKHCNIDDVVVDEAAGTVYLADPEMSLDVGSIAKGYATERVATRLL